MDIKAFLISDPGHFSMTGIRGHKTNSNSCKIFEKNPIRKGKFRSVYVLMIETYVSRKTSFCLLFSITAGDRTLINIMSSLLERYGKGDDTSTAPSNVTSLPPGFPCVAQFTEDGMWYRGRVVKYVDEDKVEVN